MLALLGAAAQGLIVFTTISFSLLSALSHYESSQCKIASKVDALETNLK